MLLQFKNAKHALTGKKKKKKKLVHVISKLVVLVHVQRKKKSDAATQICVDRYLQ